MKLQASTAAMSPSSTIVGGACSVKVVFGCRELFEHHKNPEVLATASISYHERTTVGVSDPRSFRTRNVSGTKVRVPKLGLIWSRSSGGASSRELNYGRYLAPVPDKERLTLGHFSIESTASQHLFRISNFLLLHIHSASHWPLDTPSLDTSEYLSTL